MKLTRRAVFLSCFLVSSMAWSGRGAAELSLDAASVKEILGAALSAPTRIDLAGLGTLTIETGPVRTVELARGGVEAVVSVRIRELDLTDDVRVRFVPEIERTTGTARLAPEEVHLSGLPLDFDLSRWLPPAELPRSVEWDFEMGGDRPLSVRCYVQGIAVEDDRLRIELGLVGR